jgi:hypothetical protein
VRGTRFRGARHLVDDGGDDLQVVEQLAGALVVDVVGSDAGEEQRGGGEGRGQIFDQRQVEGLSGVEVAELLSSRFAPAGGVVEVAELLFAERG